MQIPVPAHIHYELLLRILERQTTAVVSQADYGSLEDLQELLRTLRKALAQQKLLEERWERQGFHLDPRWSYEQS
ncbi:DUF5340 domain-containing protein [Gloeobacter kilaueensis]|uniref:Uncharacterized protein n=1 Tax=Gloeobacter kilaueensis (strain ATCC BAA-2537 / CCAP 1431/1 / ULC 316 / JS1) TaxID=1183438 RepID=U5QH18_GLOK1|nr:DUF5340 domain-containing protein [Gloeobacter kilaueensis]AGY58236.1 hypothetical protein GKIL_1990 [Gloeobacter kilaueensis JS1]